MAEESGDLRKERAKSSTSPAELEKLAGDEDEYVRSKASLACLLNGQFVSDLLENK